MTDRIREHIDRLFQGAPRSGRVAEAREELLTGCLDKYEDLIREGRTPEEAYSMVISGIGNVDELINAIHKVEQMGPQDAKNRRTRRALFISAGIFLYAVAVALTVVVDFWGDGTMSGLLFLLVAGLATAVIVFGVISTGVKVEPPTVSMSGQIQSKITHPHRDWRMMGAMSGSLWSILVVIYLILGVVFGWWHPGWLIFPLGGVLQVLLKWVFVRPYRSALNVHALIWIGATFVYLVVSFATRRWGITWLIFPIAMSVQQLYILLRTWRRN